MGPPSWWDLPVLTGAGTAVAWNARRQGYGGSTSAAVAVVFGLFILADLCRLLRRRMLRLRRRPWHGRSTDAPVVRSPGVIIHSLRERRMTPCV